MSLLSTVRSLLALQPLNGYRQTSLSPITTCEYVAAGVSRVRLRLFLPYYVVRPFHPV